MLRVPQIFYYYRLLGILCLLPFTFMDVQDLRAQGLTVQNIEIWQGIDYGEPGTAADTRYVFRFRAVTGQGVELVEILTAAGSSLQILADPEETRDGAVTRVYADGESLVWEYLAWAAAADFLGDNFGDGDFTVTFSAAFTTAVTAVVPFSVPDTGGEPISAVDGEPELNSPAGSSLVAPEVEFSWVAPGAAQASGVRLAVNTAAEPDGISVYEHFAGPETEVYGPLPLNEWTDYKWSLAKLRSYTGTTAAAEISFEVGRFAEAHHIFATSGQTWTVSGHIGYAGHRSGAILVQAFRAPGFSGIPAAETVLAHPGAYELSGLPAGFSYVLRAFQDTDDSGVPDTLEAIGYYESADSILQFELDADLAGVDIALTDLDSNADGLPDYWKIQYGLEPLQDDSDGDGVPDALSNPDADRLNNLREYQLGTDPLQRDNVVIWFDGFRDAYRDSLAQPLSQAAAAVRGAGYTIINRDLPFSTDEFAGVDMLFIYDIQKSYMPAEIAAVQGFLDGGGRLLVFSDGADAGDAGASLNELLAPYAISISQTAISGNLETLVQPHPIVQGLSAPLRTGGAFAPVSGGASLAGNGLNSGAAAFAAAGGGRAVVVSAAAMLNDGVFTANEEGFLLNALDWLVTPWRFNLDVANGYPAGLTLAQRVGAVDGFDDYDALAAFAAPLEAQVWLESAAGNLRADYRAPAASAAWVLRVDARGAAADCVISWDQTQLPPGGMYVYEVDANGRGIPGGSGFSVNDQAGLTVNAGTLGYYRLVSGVDMFELELSPGWNLVSMPLVPVDNDPAVVLRNNQFGHVWGWRRGHYVAISELQPRKGYWVYYAGLEPVSFQIAGFANLELWAVLSSGWNLTGPVGQPFWGLLQMPLVTVPENAVIGQAAWQWFADAYQPVQDLEAGLGCWIHLSVAAEVFLGLAEADAPE